MFFRMYKRMLTGEILQTSEVPVSGAAGKFRLKLKRERSTGDLYVTLSLTTPGFGEYQYLSPEQFRALVAAVRETEKAFDKAEEDAKIKRQTRW